MILKEILKGLRIKQIRGETDKKIKGLTDNSKEVKEDYLFVAVKGRFFDGHKFIPEALRKGAKVIVGEEKFSFLPFSVTWVEVEDSRQALSLLCERFYGNPSLFLNVVGITGTNGKTTTSYLISSILEVAGENVGRIGTVGYSWGDRCIPSSYTTPPPPLLEKILGEMKEERVKWVIMEVSSHALHLRRVEGVNFQSAIFTNVTREHLDFHGTFKDYLTSKLRLIDLLTKSKKERKFLVINKDSPYLRDINLPTSFPVYWYGCNSVPLKGYIKEMNWEGMEIEVYAGSKKENFSFPLTGEFNLYNALASISWARGEGIDWGTIRKGLRETSRVPGRMEVMGDREIKVVVDYAHTPDALESLLKTLRKMTPGKVITVFGCGGNRDRGKRPLMGKVASQYSDYIFLTNDNPREEDPLQIIKDIEKGIDGDCRWEVIPDREEAIYRGIMTAEKGDCVTVAGKGHENYQIFGDVVLPFSDREVVKKFLKERKKRRVKICS